MMECSDNALSSALIEWKRAESQENCVTVGTPAMMNWQPSPKDDVSISGLGANNTRVPTVSFSLCPHSKCGGIGGMGEVGSTLSDEGNCSLRDSQ